MTNDLYKFGANNAFEKACINCQTQGQSIGTEGGIIIIGGTENLLIETQIAPNISTLEITRTSTGDKATRDGSCNINN